MDVKKKIKAFLKKALFFIVNPRLLLCLGIAWIITNGWAYICIFLGHKFDLPWLATISTAYATFLWLPFTAEKLLTIPIAIFLLRVIFPKDEKTLKVLTDMMARVKTKIKESTSKRKADKAERKKANAKNIESLESEGSAENPTDNSTDNSTENLSDNSSDNSQVD